VVTETLKGGWLRGAAVAAGPLLADGPIVILAIALTNQLPPAFEPAMSLVGGVFLIYLAYGNDCCIFDPFGHSPGPVRL
jgi:threonine/homoserine/homoserine lactone efflux protein